MIRSYLTLAFPILTVVCLILFFGYYYKAMRPRAGTTEWISRMMNRPRFGLSFKRHPMTRRDVLPVTVITLVFAFLGFFNLGDTTAPQSFFRFTEGNPVAVIALDEPADIGTFMFYTGLWTGHYTLELSEDGVNWREQLPLEDHEHAMHQPHADLFKWRYADINSDNPATRFIRLTASGTPMELGEIALYTPFGDQIAPARISSADAPALLDEPELIPPAPSYMNSMYFDEIYHGRTAYEYLNGVTVYETTHPPLGKLILSIGISLFGMVPFGWRFMGTLFGVVMLPILYVLLKNMFGRTMVATCGTLLFGFDFMRFVQTRIATIDTYAVFFILLSYFFMYRFLIQDEEAPFSKTLAPLGLSGLFFGIGFASKWSVAYAGLGLLALYVLRLYRRGKYYKNNDLGGYGGYLAKTLCISLVFFVLVPAVVYCLSYIPNGYLAGMRLGGMLTDPAFYKLVWNNQTFMYKYHSALEATHSYSSVWWQWILDARPILYYRDTSMGGGLKSAFASFGNPVVWWGGLLAMFAMVYRTVRFKDTKALFILIGYLSQLAPWFVISRVVFIYHYFPASLFLVLAIAHVFDTLIERDYGRSRLAAAGFTGAAGGLFAAFYPVLTGVAVPERYTTYFLRWIPHMWPF